MVSNALYGLQGCSCEYPEVRKLIAALTVKVANCEEKFKPQEASNAVYGLQGSVE